MPHSAPAPLRLMLVESDPAGHRLAFYVRFVARAAKRRGWEVRLLTTQRTTKHPAYRTIAEETGDIAIPILPAETPAQNGNALALLLDQIRGRAVLRKGFARAREIWAPDIVHVSTLDRFDKAVGLLGSPFGGMPFSALQMAVGFHRRAAGVVAPPTRNDAVLAQLFKRLLRTPTLVGMAVIDEPLAQYAEQQSDIAYRKVRLVPEGGALSGTESSASARAALGIPAAAFVVLAYGEFSERKGIRELLAGAEGWSHDRPLYVVIAGVRDAATQSVIGYAKASDRFAIVDLDRFVSDEDEFRVFRSADAVWLGYRDFYGSSGVLFRAAFMGLPAIAMNSGLIAWLTERHGLGLIVDPADREAVGSAMAQLATDIELNRRIAAVASAFGAKHTADAFGDAVCDMVADGYAGFAAKRGAQ